MRKMMFVAFLFCFIQTYAKTPIPEALLNAKTAFVGNEGADAKDFDKFCKLLKDWGRFEFVQDKKAPILLSLFLPSFNIELFGCLIRVAVLGVSTPNKF